jgi:hypothetical protein
MPAPSATARSAASAGQPRAAVIAAQPAAMKPARVSPAQAASLGPGVPATAGGNTPPPAMVRPPPLALRAAPVVTSATAADRIAARLPPWSPAKPISASGPVQGALDKPLNPSAGGRNGRRLLRSLPVSA